MRLSNFAQDALLSHIYSLEDIDAEDRTTFERQLLEKALLYDAERQTAPESQPVVDLTTIPTPDRTLIEKAWPEGVMYRNRSVFDSLYVSGYLFSAFAKLIPENNQECYLGYIPRRDRFVVGFDTWPDEDGEEDNKNSVFTFEMNVERGVARILDIQSVDGMEPMFYHNNLQELKCRYADLVDIRLD